MTPLSSIVRDVAPDAGVALARLEAEVVRPGWCTHCGTCAGLSAGALEMRDTPRGPLPVAAGSSPALLPVAALDACPGRGLSYPDLHRSVFGARPHDWLLGCHRAIYIAYARTPEIRRRGASGGVITAALAYLLEQRRIDGAVVVRQGHPRPWQAAPVLARSVDEVLASSQSVYIPVPVNTLLAEMTSFPGRLAYVGLPDQVASLRRLQQLGHAGATKAEYVLGPYVGTAMYFGAIESYLRAHGVRRLDDVVDLRYREGVWPGYLQVTTRAGAVLRIPKFHYNYLIPFYITRSSLFSVDFTNELTDISVGDAWHPRYERQGQGFSVVIARTARGEALLQTMSRGGWLSLEPVTRAEALEMHGHMLDFKKRGAFIRLGWQAALGKRVPDHGYRPLRISMTRRLAEAVIVAIFAVCGTQPARRMAEWIPARLMGPLFDGLRKAWKRVSKPTKRRGLQDLVFEITTGDGAAPRARQITHESLWRRAAREIGYWRRATWTLEEVAEHWDRTDAYDEINAATYAYARRFADALRLSAMPDRAHTLDLCARTGLGTLYFHQRGKIGAAVCADVSLTMGEICRRRLRDHGVDPLTWVRIDGEVLPFENATFDAVLCFESVEHFPRPAVLLAELGRVTRPGGTLLLTTPNVLWEPAHALAAITGIHHSEGPHRFIRYRRLIAMLARAGFRVTRAETTVLIPAGPRWLLRFGEWLEEKTRYSLLPLAGLRRIIVCSKQ